MKTIAVLSIIASMCAVPAMAYDYADPGQGQGQDQGQKDRDDKGQKDKDQKDKDQKDKDHGEKGQKDRDHGDKGQDDHGQKDPHQKPGQGDDDQEENATRLERFNVVCYYNNAANPDGFKACRASALFDKVVTLDGGEVVDESPVPGSPLSSEIPYFKVECDNTTKYGGERGRRFTDLLSTRIQGLSGPLPAIYLPRGALHIGRHVADSYLEIDTGLPENKLLRTAGVCHIWTGAP